MESAVKIREGLSQCTGTQKYWTHWTKVLVYTDGIKYLAEKAEAYWLIDLIASHKRKEHFQVWKLKVNGSKAIVTMKEDVDQPELVKQEIQSTNFPLDSIQLYLIDGVLLLPSEY